MAVAELIRCEHAHHQIESVVPDAGEVLSKQEMESVFADSSDSSDDGSGDWLSHRQGWWSTPSSSIQSTDIIISTIRITIG